MTSFITDFNTWRKSQISTNYSSSSSVDVSTLTPEKFMALTPFQDVTDSTTSVTTKKDIVKTEADSYLINLILYNLNDQALKVLDIARPSLSTEILNTFQNDETAKTDLTKYSNLWLLSTFYQQSKDSKSVNRVKIQPVNDDFKVLQTGKTVTAINMKLTYIATAKKCPGFLPYMYNSDTMIDKVKTYLMDETYKTTWVNNAFNELKVNYSSTDTNDNARLMELKSKLDILDPSFNLSSVVINDYYCHLYALFAPFSKKKSPKVHKIYSKVTLDALKKVEAKTDHPWYEILTKAKEMFAGNIASLSGQISRALFRMHWDPIVEIKTMSPEHVMTFDTARFMKVVVTNSPKGQLNTSDPKFAQLWKDENMHRMLSGIYILCNAASIYSAWKSYDKLTTMEKILLWVNTAVSGVDAITSVVEAASSAKNVYIWIGQRLTKLMQTGSIKPASTAKNASKFAKYFKLNWIMKYITAGLVLVSMAFTVYDIVTSIQNQDWGMLALSLGEFALEFGVLILTFMTATAWSGPVCLILTAVLVVIGVVKMFWEQIKQFFKDVSSLINMLFNGDPVNNYIKACDAKYCLTDDEYKAATVQNLREDIKLHPENKEALEVMINILLYGQTTVPKSAN